MTSCKLPVRNALCVYYRCRDKSMFRTLLIILAPLAGLLMSTSVTYPAQQWSDDDRRAAVKRLLKSKASAFKCKRRCSHEVFDVRELDFGDHTKKLITAVSSDPSHDCHACAPELSYFLYRVDADGWKLTSSHIAYHLFGSWGTYVQDMLRFVAVSQTVPAIILEFGYTGQGYTEESATVLVARDGKLEKVLATCSGSDNSGAIVDPQTQSLTSWSGSAEIAGQAASERMADIVFNISDKAANSSSTATFEYSNGRYRFASGDKRMSDCSFE